MADYRVLWVHPREQLLKCGETYAEDQIREAGYDPAAMAVAGEAELVSPAEPPAAPKRKAK